MKKINLLMGLLLIVICGCESQEATAVKSEDPPREENQSEEQENAKNETEDEENPISFLKGEPREIVLAEGFESLENFKPDPLKSKNKASYHLHTKMDEKGRFTVLADITVANLSDDKWNEVLFYLIPNAFTKENKPDYMANSSTVSVEGVRVNDVDSSYKLEKDLFYVELPQELGKNQSTNITVSYSFTVPEGGIRFSQKNGSFYLAQWYPMLATYRDGWHIEKYDPMGESYHTTHSDFIVEYELPEEYSVLSSSDQDPSEPSLKGMLEQNNIKDFFIAFTSNMTLKSTNVNNIEVRVSSFNNDTGLIDSTLELASDAIQYFEKHVGPYPHKQIDIILDQGGMEYSGIVTVGTSESVRHTIVHEIAHQWFYGMVSNNPYYDTWIDEGLTQFLSYLYFGGNEGQKPEEIFSAISKNIDDYNRAKELLPVHLSLPEYYGGPYFFSNYELPSVKIWELAGDLETSLGYLETYLKFYAYTEVDTHEWIRFTKSYFQMNDNSYFSDWIELGDSQ